MKTTVEIADPLLREAKEVAAREGTTLRELIEAGLRKAVDERRGESGFRLRRASFRGKGLQPHLREGDWEALRELVYEERGGLIALDTNLLIYAHREGSASCGPRIGTSRAFRSCR